MPSNRWPSAASRAATRRGRATNLTDVSRAGSVDTNLWVYRLDRRDEDKRQRVSDWLRGLVAEHEIVLSTQVLIERRAVLSRKFTPALPHADVRAALAALAAFEVVVTDAALIHDAHELAASEQLSWFDALIVEAALRSGCRRLYSEDLGHGRRFGELEVYNPLRGEGR